jgi:hypothetical protein
MADKLRRLEPELRLLNVKAIAAAEGTNALGVKLAPRVEALYAALDTIRRLVSDIEADVQPHAADMPASKRQRSDRDD